MYRHLYGERTLMLAGLLFLSLFSAFTIASKRLSMESIDERGQRLAETVAGGALHPFFAAIEPVGAPFASLVLAIALALMLAASRGLLIGIAALTVLAVLTLIEASLRIRFDALPWEHLIQFLQHPRGWHLVHSPYPSGHVARLALLAGIAAVTFARRWPLAGIAGVVGITLWIGLQRIESGSHSPADVIGGALLAWGLALLFASALPSLRRMEETLRRRYSRGA